MKKILLIDDSDTYTWCLQKYLQHRGYPVKTACTLKEARAAIQEEMPLVVCCDLDLPDGSGMDFLDEVRAADKELPFILASCHDKDDYEQEAMRRGATPTALRACGRIWWRACASSACWIRGWSGICASATARWSACMPAAMAPASMKRRVRGRMRCSSMCMWLAFPFPRLRAAC